MHHDGNQRGGLLYEHGDRVLMDIHHPEVEIISLT